MKRAAEAFLENGAREVTAMATHGVFSSKAAENLASPALSRVILANTLPVTLAGPKAGIEVVDIAPLIADAIDGLHQGKALTDLES